MSDSEEEEINVTRFKHEGVDYLKDDDDYLYDPKTSEVVGYWNLMTQQIEEVVELDTDDESNDEQDQGSNQEEEVRPIYGLIEINPQYSKAEIEEMFAESDNVSYVDK
tara:strand:- start:407 stop:730 length:324 start_codon:yes stop_codon:yes gene_type:complete